MIFGPVRVALVCGLWHLAPLGIIQPSRESAANRRQGQGIPIQAVTLHVNEQLESSWDAIPPKKVTILFQALPMKGIPFKSLPARFQWFQPKQHRFHFSTRRFDGCPYQGKHTAMSCVCVCVRKSSPIIWECHMRNLITGSQKFSDIWVGNPLLWFEKEVSLVLSFLNIKLILFKREAYVSFQEQNIKL